MCLAAHVRQIQDALGAAIVSHAPVSVSQLMPLLYLSIKPAGNTVCGAPPVLSAVACIANYASIVGVTSMWWSGYANLSGNPGPYSGSSLLSSAITSKTSQYSESLACFIRVNHTGQYIVGVSSSGPVRIQLRPIDLASLSTPRSQPINFSKYPLLLDATTPGLAAGNFYLSPLLSLSPAFAYFLQSNATKTNYHILAMNISTSVM